MRRFFTPMTSAERARKRRARLLSKGLCQTCGLIRRSKHALSCEACLWTALERYHRRKAEASP